MARTKVVLPPDSTGQAMGVTTYSNGSETVAAPETVLVSTTGTPITPTTPSDTQPISAAALPLPSGAATAAKQPALGTAGSASADVLSVQGIASMTALKVDASATTQPISGTVTVQDGGGAISIDDNGGTVSIDDGGGSLTVDGTVGVSGTVTVDSELTTADLDTGAGTDPRAVVGLVYGGNGGGTLVSATNPLPIGDNGGSLTVDGTFWQGTQPVSGTVTASQGGAPWADNVTQLGGTAIDTNSGAKSAGTQRVVLATDQPQLTNALKVDGSATTQPVSGTVTANAGSGTLAVSLAAGATAPAKAEDVASADADVGIPAMAVRKATPANTSGTDGDYEMLQMSAGRLWASATIDAALPAGTAAIGKLAANDGVDIGDATINNASGASAVNVQDGGNSLTVDNGGTFATQAAQSGTWTVQPGNTANTTAWKVDGSAVTQPVNSTGNVAHDGVDSGNPVKVGHKAVDHGANPTAVAASDRTDWYANRAGVPFVIGGHPNIITRRDNFTAAQTNVALVTVAAGLKIVVTRILITCANSNSVDVSCTVGFGTANTPTGAGVVADHPGIPKGGGLNTGDGSGILGVGADNEDLRITCSVPTGGSISVVTSYYTIES